jgi:hypothetical protein
MPLRLGGSEEDGWTAAQHARVCADLVALKRSAFLAVWTYTKSGTSAVISDYYGLNGAGSLYQPDSISAGLDGHTTFAWSARLFEDPYQVSYPINVKGGRATGHGTASLRAEVVIAANGVTVWGFDSAGNPADGKFTVVII